MIVLIESPDPEQPVRPKKHDADQAQTIEAELTRCQLDIILELGVDFVIAIHQIIDQLTVYRTQQSHNTKDEEVELCSADPYPVLEVIYNEDEDRREEVDGVDDGQRQVKLSCSDGKPMDHHYEVPLEYVLEVDVVLVIKPHIVVSHYREV